jgi:effector-binding domain-containing protein
MRLILLILSVSLALSIFFCEKGFKERKPAGLKVEEKIIEPFYYVAQIMEENSLDHNSEIENFLDELKLQDVKQTGPLMAISYNFPDTSQSGIPSFALAARVNDSMSVKNPLVCQKWNYVDALSFSLTGPRDSFKRIYSLLNNYIEKNNFTIIGPAMERLLDPFPSPGHPADSLRMEIWVPYEKK